ncbi:MAG: ChbG/HpnK family deacetylase [Bacilli bacterium]|nr:ChbG/HpnK family deacetylase [Bacilli bacterium]
MKLIINADDFGLSKSITDGIIEGILNGYITSTTIMVNMDYAEYAIKKAIEKNIYCIGLHINLTVGKPIIQNSHLTDGDGAFLYNQKQIDNPRLTYEDVYTEIKAQIAKVDEYSSGKIKINHLDFHHHLLSNKYIKQAAIAIAKELNIPVRNENITNYKCPDILYKDFTIKNVNIDCLKNMILKYSDKDIVVELMTHPGYIDEYTRKITSYIGREEELNILHKAKIMGLFDKITLISYKEF